MVTRRLTEGEIALARVVFGDSIDYARVKVSDRPYAFFHPQNTAMAPNGNLYMHDCYSADYARAAPAYRNLFIHEMTHVWQYQNKILNPIAAAVGLSIKHKFNYSAAYPFLLTDKNDLTDYGMEQQAAILEEYFSLKHGRQAPYTRHCQNSCDADEKLQLFEKVLGNFLKDPSYARRKGFFNPSARHRPASARPL